jgi:hypothetical protein
VYIWRDCRALIERVARRAGVPVIRMGRNANLDSAHI